MRKVVVLLLIGLIMITGCSVKKTEELSSAERFAVEYSISEDNPFEYATIDEVLDIIKNKSGIIFFGNSDCEWCIESASILNDALNYKNIEKVYYYNPKDIREKNTKKYQELVELLGDNLEKDENGESYLYLPDVYFIKNGKVIGHNNDTATMSGNIDEALTEENKKKLRKAYLELISEYNTGECTNNC